jgi:hypothetical protein
MTSWKVLNCSPAAFTQVRFIHHSTYTRADKTANGSQRICWQYLSKVLTIEQILGSSLLDHILKFTA